MGGLRFGEVRRTQVRSRRVVVDLGWLGRPEQLQQPLAQQLDAAFAETVVLIRHQQRRTVGRRRIDPDDRDLLFEGSADEPPDITFPTGRPPATDDQQDVTVIQHQPPRCIFRLALRLAAAPVAVELEDDRIRPQQALRIGLMRTATGRREAAPVERQDALQLEAELPDGCRRDQRVQGPDERRDQAQDRPFIGVGRPQICAGILNSVLYDAQR